ncbi:hypothetical protein N780_06235 [Pontibacillus chungwhensis BH030062]|uniref:Tetratricopeptide repeat protein n=1 Tax=Pontibacillus chungwhensis BH030062 TaxID=1385513 RepID=A0A0A2UU93_9BACI|nr:hypothetical protein [Pontibacillus chungwhensis]KGP90308.1 hypothetical protein N780_06235 [Pontibacillus chungwhensis BH030062]
MLDLMLSPWVWVLFFILHAIVVLVLLILLKDRFDGNEQAVVVWVGLVSCFMPLLGELIGLLTWFLAKRFTSEEIFEDYDEYVSYDVLNLEPIRHEAKRSVDLLPLSESLTLGTFANRKNSILQYISEGVSHQGKYLWMGLLNEDHETVHYSATLMNTLVDQHERELSLAKEKAQSNDLESLKRLHHAYARLIDSEVLSPAVRKQKEEMWLSFLLSIVLLYPDEPWIYEGLGDCSNRLLDHQDAVLYYQQLIELSPSYAKGYTKLLKAYYENHNWSGMKQVIQLSEKYVDPEDLSEDDLFVLQVLGGKVM